MSEPSIEPLSEDCLRALAIERERPEDGTDVASRVLARVTASIAAAPIPAQTGAGSAISEVGRKLSAKSIAILVGTFVAGGLIGAAIHASVQAPVVVISTSNVPIVPPSVTHSGAAVPSIDVTSLPLAAPSSTGVASPPTRATASTSAPSNDRDADLARERALVERARMAVAKGNGPSALAAVDAHEKDFPAGRLTEECEALAVEALVLAGRVNEAEQRAARFREQYPGSVHGAAVNAALRRTK